MILILIITHILIFLIGHRCGYWSKRADIEDKRQIEEEKKGIGY